MDQFQIVREENKQQEMHADETTRLSREEKAVNSQSRLRPAWNTKQNTEVAN
jgi:hypothetical protein